MDKLVGRKDETRILSDALQSSDAELIAIYGRRRVGKTFLVRSFYKDNLAFEFSGVHEATLKQQLLNFSQAMKRAAGSPLVPAVPHNWIEAFYMLQEFLVPKLNEQKAVVFFDEFPWIHTLKSGFLPAFGHFWNTWASMQKNLVVVICGSAASWMIRNIVNNKGGLHNRITRRIRLLPFMLTEVEEYLQSRQVNMDRYQLLQIYLAMGGIPQYLMNIKPGESATQAIDRICFTKDGALKGEFNTLYQSLFDNADNHIAVIKALAARGMGLTRIEIIRQCNLSTGGTATRLLEELVESGFITPYIPFKKNVRDIIYKLTDEFSLFYMKFMDKTRATGQGTWLRLSETPSWRSWSAVAFEGICLKHIAKIKKALGISGVLTEESIWRYFPARDEQGVQIDLLIDRRDHCINICEIKYATTAFTIEKAYSATLQQKLNIFREKTKTRKTLLLTMITTYGVNKNIYYTGYVHNEVILNDLFNA